MRLKMLTKRAPFCIGAMAKKGTLSQHFVTRHTSSEQRCSRRGLSKAAAVHGAG